MRNGMRVTALGLFLALAGGCQQMGIVGAISEKKADTAQTKLPEVVMPVRAETPTRGSISSYLSTNARVEAERRVDVTSEGMGKCLGTMADEGDWVKQGQILAELDKDQARAQLGQTEVQVRQSRADFERSRELAKSGLISKAEFDSARFAYEQGLASLRLQQVQLENQTIKAPISGVITARNIQKGMLVTSGTPAFSIVDPDSLRLVINPSEKEVQNLRLGQTALVTVDSLGDEVFDTRVALINPVIEQTGTVRVILELKKEDRLKLRDGAFARVRLILDTREDALLVPKDAVLEENGRAYVFVVDEAPADGSGEGGEISKTVAKRVEIDTGYEDSFRVEVLAGLDDTAQVITMGQYNLRPGAPIRVTTAEAELDAKRDLSLADALKLAEEKRAKAREENPNTPQDNRRRSGRRMP